MQEAKNKKQRRVRSIAVSSLVKSVFRFLEKPEHFFLTFSILFGGLFVFLTPPLQVPDEQAHFIRAYQVSDLDFISQKFKLNGETRYGSQLPVSITKADGVFLGNVAGHAENQFPKSIFRRYIGQPLKPHKTQETIVEAAGVYSPIIYIPQAIGISIGKIFQASPLVLIWLGRLCNLAFWVGIMYLAIRMFPIAKWAIVLLALNPVAVFLSASLSPDVTNISFAFLFVSMVLATYRRTTVLSNRYIAALIGVFAVLALSKPVDLLFGLLLFAIPWQRFGTKAKYWLCSIGGFLVGFILFALWNYEVSGILVNAVKYQYAGISDSGQLHYVLHHPVTYIKIILENYVIITPGTAGDAVLGSFFGVLGWLDTPIPLWTIYAYVLILFLAALYQFGRGLVLTLWQKATFLGIFVLGSVGNVTAMYFNSTTVGNRIVAGVQGRYFIAFSVLLLVLFTARKKILDLTNRTMATIALSGMIIVLGMTALKLFLRYYH